mmetsp:Transcript_21013/g.37830  ORF Transcript_21013/g.37830 Transcript_21013/m.37830 type:complete len:281 (-) Transcript_21013:2557-3399(-)
MYDDTSRTESSSSFTSWSIPRHSAFEIDPPLSGSRYRKTAVAFSGSWNAGQPNFVTASLNSVSEISPFPPGPSIIRNASAVSLLKKRMTWTKKSRTTSGTSQRYVHQTGLSFDKSCVQPPNFWKSSLLSSMFLSSAEHMYWKVKKPDVGVDAASAHVTGTPLSLKENSEPSSRTSLGSLMFAKRADSFMFMRTASDAATRSSLCERSKTNLYCSGWTQGQRLRDPSRCRRASHSTGATRARANFTFCGSVMRKKIAEMASTRVSATAKKKVTSRICLARM